MPPRSQLPLFSLKKPRRERDAYFTPLSAVDALSCYQDLSGRLLDPCCGDGTMAARLASRFTAIHLNDIAPQISSETQSLLSRTSEVKVTTFCAQTVGEVWSFADWVVTNPPWSLASEFALSSRRAGANVALLLRLSFLEGTRKRAWLRIDPPKLVLVLPRISFSGDGRHDSVVPAWFLWGESVSQRGIRVLTPEDLKNCSRVAASQRKEISP